MAASETIAEEDKRSSNTLESANSEPLGKTTNEVFLRGSLVFQPPVILFKTFFSSSIGIHNPVGLS